MSPLRASVRAIFPAFTERFEGRIPWLYRDSKNLVTIGAGVLVDPAPRALALPLRHPDGSRASADQILDEWQKIKDCPGLDVRGAQAAGQVARLRLTPDDLDALTLDRLDATVAALARRFPSFAAATAPEQLALCSLAWAAGSGFRFPKMENAVLRRDLVTAAIESKIDEAKTKGVHERNLANRRLLLLAAATEADGGDPDALDLRAPTLEQLEARFGLRPGAPAPPAEEGPVEGASEGAALAYMTPIEGDRPDDER